MVNKISLAALPPLALYIHFPWCEKKCPYCDFNSHQIKDSSSMVQGDPKALGEFGGEAITRECIWLNQ
jgi:hypothetical protein